MGTTTAIVAMLWATLILNTVDSLTDPIVIDGHAVPHRVDIDGRLMVPADINGDGYVIGDIEWGS